MYAMHVSNMNLKQALDKWIKERCVHIDWAGANDV